MTHILNHANAQTKPWVGSNADPRDSGIRSQSTHERAWRARVLTRTLKASYKHAVPMLVS